jgi:hypothetical protein
MFERIASAIFGVLLLAWWAFWLVMTAGFAGSILWLGWDGQHFWPMYVALLYGLPIAAVWCVVRAVRLPKKKAPDA